MSTNRVRELDTFESALLTELKGVVAERATTPVPDALEPNAEPPRRRRTLGWAAAAAAAATIAIVATNLGSAPSAFAVSKASDGQVTVTINQLEGAEALEDALAAHGIRADVTYPPEGKGCAPGRYTEAAPDASRQPMSAGMSQEGKSTFTIPSGYLRSGETFVIESTWPGGADQSWAVRLGIAEGAVAECQLVDVDWPRIGPAPSGPGADSGSGVAEQDTVTAGP